MSSIKQRIEELKKEIKELEFQLALKRNAVAELEQVIAKRSPKQQHKPKGLRAGSLAARLKKILDESDSPLSVSQLIEKLKQNDYESKTDLKTVVPSALSRRLDTFVRVKYGVYGLVGKHEKKD
ncbi:MAG: hypothetical protein WC374_01510 [Phycisphaerae bacterium]|jgi:uncharacterized coiled-coil protein SlyX